MTVHGWCMLQSMCTNCSSRVYQHWIHESKPQSMRFRSADMNNRPEKKSLLTAQGTFFRCVPALLLKMYANSSIWQNQICCSSKRKHQVLLQKVAQKLYTTELEENRSWQFSHQPISAPPCWVFVTEKSTNNSEILWELGSAQPPSGQQKTSCSDLLTVWHPIAVTVATMYPKNHCNQSPSTAFSWPASRPRSVYLHAKRPLVQQLVVVAVVSASSIENYLLTYNLVVLVIAGKQN